jgi:hypothetical protein
MTILRNAFTATLLMLSSWLYADDAAAVPQAKVLFIYDKIDKGSRFYVDAFKQELGRKARTVEEAAVESTPSAADPSSFRYLVIYSRVMAFNMISPVKKWIKQLKSLKDKKIFLYVTSNRFGHEANLKSLLKLVGQRGGIVVDAVTMATNKMSEGQKRAAIAKHLEKLTP